MPCITSTYNVRCYVLILSGVQLLSGERHATNNLKFYFFLYMFYFMRNLPVCLGTASLVCNAHGGQKRASNSLELHDVDFRK